MIPKYSFRDSKGLLWVACNECERGGNGTENNKCCARESQKKSFSGLGCFLGKLIDKYKGDKND